jgi:DNA polymerase I
MRLLAFDTETYLIQPTDAAPKPVVCSWADADTEWLTDPGSFETAAAFFDPNILWIGQSIAYDLVLMMRWHPHLIPPIMQMLDEGRVFDTQMRERMLHLKHVGSRGYNMFPSLGDMTLKYLKKDVSADKNGDDIWRLKYGTLDGVPFDQWPHDARRYAMEDARHTFEVFKAQGGVMEIQPTEALQVQAAVVLNAIGVWGFAINQDKRKVISDALNLKAAGLHKQIDSFGWTGKGSQERLMTLVSQAWHYKHFQFIQTKAQVTGVQIDVATWQQYIKPTMDIRTLLQQSMDAGAPLPGLTFPPGTDWKLWNKETIKGLQEIPMTKKGVSIAGEVLEQLGDVVKEFATYTELRHVEKMIENYIAPYKYGTAHPRFVPLVTTGRTGCRGSESAGNQQNIPRKDKSRPDEGFRTMFKARQGRVLGTVDYSQLELCTLAATIRTFWPGVVCTLGDAIDAGKDVHCITGSLVSGMTYEAMIAGKKAKDPHVVDVRQASKAVNFGKPGGLGLGAFIGYAKNNYGVELTRSSAYKIISAWERAWPEIPNVYLKHSESQINASPTETFTALTITGRPKANCIYTEGSNYPFQGLAADGAKAALWAIWREAVLGWYWSNNPGLGYGSAFRDSPLRDSRIVNFVHDEIVCEHPEGDASKAAMARQEALMISEMTRICQNKIKISVEGNLSDAWEH